MTPADLAAAARQAGWNAAIEAAAKHVAAKCPKCGGEGWIWGPELDDYDPPQPGMADDTKYSCDGDLHIHIAAIRAMKETDQ